MGAVLEAWETPAFTDPMHALKPAERTLLRKLSKEGPAISIGFRKGWMLGGTRYGEKALNRFYDLKLARIYRDADGLKLGLNDIGDLLAWKITPSKPGFAPPDD